MRERKGEKKEKRRGKSESEIDSWKERENIQRETESDIKKMRVRKKEREIHKEREKRRSERKGESKIDSQKVAPLWWPIQELQESFLMQ